MSSKYHNSSDLHSKQELDFIPHETMQHSNENKQTHIELIDS